MKINAILIISLIALSSLLCARLKSARHSNASHYNNHNETFQVVRYEESETVEVVQLGAGNKTFRTVTVTHTNRTHYFPRPSRNQTHRNRTHYSPRHVNATGNSRPSRNLNTRGNFPSRNLNATSHVFLAVSSKRDHPEEVRNYSSSENEETVTHGPVLVRQTPHGNFTSTSSETVTVWKHNPNVKTVSSENEVHNNHHTEHDK